MESVIHEMVSKLKDKCANKTVQCIVMQRDFYVPFKSGQVSTRSRNSPIKSGKKADWRSKIVFIQTENTLKPRNSVTGTKAVKFILRIRISAAKRLL